MGGLFKRRRIFGGLMSGRYARPTACIFAKCPKSIAIASQGLLGLNLLICSKPGTQALSAGARHGAIAT
jgi:hypothetical protein